ncbi:MAG TPA: hypothetical protein VEU74_12020 [Gemmatimonadales bacterium]|nr:hypothetical protein [Gemmatimonadales bacterium]
MSVQARSNTDLDHIVGIVQIERETFKGKGVAEVIDAALPDLRDQLVEFAQKERDRGKLPE